MESSTGSMNGVPNGRSAGSSWRRRRASSRVRCLASRSAIWRPTNCNLAESCWTRSVKASLERLSSSWAASICASCSIFSGSSALRVWLRRKSSSAFWASSTCWYRASVWVLLAARSAATACWVFSCLSSFSRRSFWSRNAARSARACNAGGSMCDRSMDKPGASKRSPLKPSSIASNDLTQASLSSRAMPCSPSGRLNSALLNRRIKRSTSCCENSSRRRA
ncbi:hypothetical protein D9M71_307580 [compost metagenome]